MNDLYGYPLDPVGGGTPLPAGVNVGDVLTWDGVDWIPAPPSASALKSISTTTNIPTTNTTWTNVNPSNYVRNIGAVDYLPHIFSTNTNHFTTLSLSMPKSITSLVALKWQIVPTSLTGTGTLNFRASFVRSGVSGLLSGGNISIINPSYPATNQMFEYDLTGLLTPSIAELEGGIVSISMIVSGMSNLQNHHFGLRLDYI
jgi:hypothetical protein